MATLTITVGANSDDYCLSDVDDPNPIQVGGVSASPAAGYGVGFRFSGVTLTAADTINSALISLMAAGTQFSTVDDRWATQDTDTTQAFTNTNPNRPGDRAIRPTVIQEVHNVNHTDATRYSFPTTSPLQVNLGTVVAQVLARSGWASGNALGLIDNSAQDASAFLDFGRKSWHAFESVTASSEPQLVIDYTAGVTGIPPGIGPVVEQLGGTQHAAVISMMR